VSDAQMKEIQCTLALAEKCHGPGGIDECNIARHQAVRPDHLDYRRLPEVEAEQNSGSRPSRRSRAVSALPGAHYNRYPSPRAHKRQGTSVEQILVGSMLWSKSRPRRASWTFMGRGEGYRL